MTVSTTEQLQKQQQQRQEAVPLRSGKDDEAAEPPLPPHTPSTTEYLLTHYRGLLCLFFLLPLSALFELYLFARNYLNFLTRWRAPRKHAARVAMTGDDARAEGCTSSTGA